MKIGARLRKTRLAQGLSLREVAAAAKMSPTYLHQIEHDKLLSPPTVERISSLARILDMDPDDLVAQFGRLPEQIRREARQLNQRLQRQLLDVVRRVKLDITS